jgi:hypothetical protein
MEKKTGVVPLLALLTVLVLGCGSEASGDEVVQTGEGISSATIEDFQLEWAVENDTVTVTATAPTTGWIAVGFDPSAAMKDANIIIGYVNGNELFISDDFGDGHISHSPDTELGGTSNVTGISGTEQNGTTSISFSIPMDSEDPHDTALIQGSTHKVIVAYGPDGADDFQGYHAWAETIELEL